ncbi:MBL fold metallo-hydrolase [Wenjunlia tyrosinilytica]|uniref:Metallo-beta-lactamase domain-containing protein n=1 Tax=Wenjunlia tyrosinilytica TaxID=1544741 RepID=A0A918E1T6_9ACTN|nr:MBL fold metallo-hydrolase [Wenjunlia tyrosinilytica]GGO97173.1 hypothetical protein GCM10012280_58370 [Wenjunlia tyrosinilytica]
MCGSRTPEGRTVTGGVRELAPGYHVIHTSFAAVPLHLPILTGEGLVLIDAGAAETPDAAVFSAIADLGRDPAEVRMVALTHAHHDHFGGVSNLKRRSPRLRVAVHRADVTWVEDHDRYWRELFGRFEPEYTPSEEERAVVLDQAGEPTVVQHVLDYHDELDTCGAGPLKVLPAGSHSAGSVAYYQKDHGVLATGDALQAYGTPLLDGTEAFPIYENIAAYRSMLTQFCDVDIQWLVDAHRGVLSDDEARELLLACERFPDTFTEQLLETLTAVGEPMPLTEIAHAVQSAHYPRANRSIQLYVTTDLHLRELVRQQLLEPLRINARKHWAVV